MTLLDERPGTRDVESRPPASARPAPTRVASDAEPRSWAGAWSIALVVAILSWDSAITRIPVTSIDDSWRYMLQVAARDGLKFGRDTAFTYGPLLHLDGGPMYSLAAGLASVGVALALSWLMALFVLRRCEAAGVHGWPARFIALIATVVVVPPLRFSETVALLACGWLLAQIVDGAPHARAPFAVAALAGVWFLVKPSAAIVMLGAAVLAAASGPFLEAQSTASTRELASRAVPRAGLAGLVASAVALTGWLATGQDVALIDDYYRGAQQIAAGFAEGMAIDPSNPNIEVGFILMAVGVTAVFARRALVRPDVQVIATLVFLLAIFAWTRQIALARPGWSHLKDAGSALMIVTLALWPALGRRAGHALGITATILTIGVLLPAPYYQTGTFASAGPLEFGLAIGELVDHEATVANGRDMLAPRMTVGDPIRERLDAAGGDATVWYAPFLGAGSFVNGTTGWFPPAVQSYASFTDELETLGRDAVLGPDGPDLIVYRHNYAIDEHRPAWESPGMAVSVFCGYESVTFDRQFALLERVPRECVTEPLATTVEVFDGAVSLPPSARACRGLVTFSVHGAEATRLDRLQQLVVRPKLLEITTGGRTWRFIAGTAAQPHVLAAPAEAWWLGRDVPTPGNVPPTIFFSDSFDERGPLTVDFECWTAISTQEST